VVLKELLREKSFGLMLEHYSVCFVARSRLAVDDGWKDWNRVSIRDSRQAGAG
jgi:hypothetical protein